MPGGGSKGKAPPNNKGVGASDAQPKIHCYLMKRTSESVQPADNFSQDTDAAGARKRTKLDSSVDEDAAAEDECEQHFKKTKLPRKQFHCTVHGTIDLHPTLCRIIDTPEFQRLRRCKQLGHASLRFPGAQHTRFEHSLGVAYKAGIVVNRIQENQPLLNVDDKDKLCVEIAALVHDIGHGPFSHQFEHVLHDYGRKLEADQDPKSKQKAKILTKWTHEEQSIKMLDHLLQKNKIDLSLDEYGALDDRDLIFIKELICGEPLKEPKDAADGESSQKKEDSDEIVCFKGRGPEKIFLYEIVSNKRTGLDVDRLDYLQRDAQTALGRRDVVSEELSKCLAVFTEPGTGRRVLAYPELLASSVMQLYAERISAYTKIYMDRKVLIMDEMVKDILLDAMHSIQIPVRDAKTGKLCRKMSIIDLICEDDMEAYSQLDDSILDMIRLSQCESDGVARASLLADRLHRRDLYVMAGNMPVQDDLSLLCRVKNDEDGKDQDRTGPFDHEHQVKWSMADEAWKDCKSVVHKHQILWSEVDKNDEQIRKDIVEMFQAEPGSKCEPTHTPPAGEDVVADSEGEEEIQSSQLALMEREKAQESTSSRRNGTELLASDLRLKKFTVHSGGGCKSKFDDPLKCVWFYNNDAKEYDGFESGSMRPHKVDPAHYKAVMPRYFCIRELKVVCVDPRKRKLAEAAVNRFCSWMNMPKAINQSSQLSESPSGANFHVENGCHHSQTDPDLIEEDTQFSQI